MSEDTNKKIETTLKLQTDQAALTATKNAVASLSADLNKLGKNDSFSELTADVKKLTQAELEAKKAADSLGQSLLEAEQQAQAPGGKGGGGSVGQALGMAGQLAGAAGAGEAGSALSTLGSSISSLGPWGVAAAAATIGLGVAIKGLKEAEEEALEAALLVLALKEDELALLKMTSDELLVIQTTRQQEVEDLKVLAATAQELADAAAAAEPKNVSGGFDNFFTNLEANLFTAGDALGLVGNTAEGLSERADELNSDLVTAEGELANVADALKSDEVAANDAAKALEDLAQQMEDDLYGAASDAGEAIREETSALGRSKEANLDRIQAINSEQRSIQAEIKILETQAVQSEKTKEKISQLNDKLSDLEREAGTVADVAGTQVSEAFKKAGEAAQKAAEDSMRAAQKAAEDAKKARQKAAEDELKTIIDFANKRAEIEFDAMVERETIAIEANREQERLLRESKQAFNQDFFQDFLGEFQRKQELAFNLKETQIGAGQSFDDVNRSVGNQLTNLTAQQNASAVTTNNYNTFNFTGPEKAMVLQLLQQIGVGGA